jgi:3-(methylthio)propanoyl-CoA dehydrogenase
MAEYTAPLRDIRFVLEHLVDLPALAKLPGFEHADPDSVLAVLEENARFMEDLVAPLNRVGDVQGSVRNDDGTVTTPTASRRRTRPTWRPAGGGVPFPADYGGGGFPWLVGIAMQEILTSANMAFSMARCSPRAPSTCCSPTPARSTRRPTCPRWSPASGPAP